MKNISKFFIGLTLSLLVFALPFSVLAGPTVPSVEITMVNGQVTDQSHNAVVGASVQITCNGHVVTETTDGSGKYEHNFTGAECPVGASVSVQATKGSQSGSGSAPVQVLVNTGTVQINIALINISVPEFGLITGLFTTVTSAAAFLMMKKRLG